MKRDADAGGTLGDLQIAVLEKASALGEHSLSGAVVNPMALRELFPEMKDEEFPFRAPVHRERVYAMSERHALRIPVPPTMQNHKHYIASLCEVVRWMGSERRRLG